MHVSISFLPVVVGVTAVSHITKSGGVDEERKTPAPYSVRCGKRPDSHKI